ncbi:MAG: hypothetical protein ACRD2D_11390, partial [Terriglobales bacterium]
MSEQQERIGRARIRAAMVATHCMLAVLACWAGRLRAQPGNSAHAAHLPLPGIPGHFVDITAQSGVHFVHRSAHTPLKYLIETMGSGVALFDCDNDGRLDIY